MPPAYGGKISREATPTAGKISGEAMRYIYDHLRGTLTGLGWKATLPAGWSFASDGGSAGQTKLASLGNRDRAPKEVFQQHPPDDSRLSDPEIDLRCLRLAVLLP